MENRTMARTFISRHMAMGVTLAAGAVLATAVAPAPAAAQEAGGRMRVLVPSFEATAGGRSRTGDRIADRLKRQINDMSTHAVADDKKVKDAIRKFGLKENEMGCVQWMQLATHVDAGLTLCGTVDEASREVSATFYSVAGSSFEVPAFQMQTEDQVAQQVVQAFGTYIRQVSLVTFCHDYIQSQAWQNALDTCNQAVELNPRSIDAQYMRGSALRELERTEESLDAFRKVLELDPMHLEALLSAGIATAKMGQQDQSQGYFKQYLELNPGNEEVRLSIATQLANAGDPAGALRLLEEALTPEASHTALEYAGHFAMNAGIAAQASGPAGDNPQAVNFFRTATRHYEAALAKAETPDRQVLTRMMIAYSNIGDTQKAIATGQRATQVAADDAATWFNYATVLRDAKQVEQALAALDRVAQIDPSYPNVSRTRALMLLDTGDLSGAVTAAKAALAKGEIEQSVAENLSQQMSATGMRLAREGRYQQATPYFAAARDLGKSERSIGMANFIEGYSLILQGDPIIRNGTTAAAGRQAKPVFERALTLLQGAAGYTEGAADRAKLMDQARQFIEVADALIKSGR
jgi:tetratricopeptide (TPR) repeat protein